MSNNIIQVNFEDPTQVTGLTTTNRNFIVGNNPNGLSELSIGTDGQIIIVDTGEPNNLRYETLYNFFMAYTNVDTSIIAGFTPIPWNVEQRSDSIYTHAANSPDITVGETGDYQIIVDVTIDSNSGGRTTSNARILKNSIEITGTRTLIYNRLSANGATSGTISWIESCTASDVISVEASRRNGSGGVFTVDEMLSIL
jgi:hypothetical protein